MQYITPTLAAFLCAVCTVAQGGTIDLGSARLSIDAKGYATLDFGAEEACWPANMEPILQITTEEGTLMPESVAVEANRLIARFPGGASCEFDIKPDKNFVLFEATRADVPPGTHALALFSLAAPPEAEAMDPLNAARTAKHTVALSAAEVNVHAFGVAAGRNDADRAGCSHTVERSGETKTGAGAACFSAVCDATPGGWSFCGGPLRAPLDLTGLKAIRAWVRGDARGELLKFQLSDGSGGCRDTYVPVTFEGWQQVTVTSAPYDTLHYDQVRALGLYYNGLPPSQTVTCLIDHVEALVDRNGIEESILLEDFAPPSSLWKKAGQILHVETIARHGLMPARFGLLAAPNDAFPDTMQRFEQAAGLPSPRPDGVWNKLSPRTKRSYLFITAFSEPQFEQVAAMAHRGGFDTILILQDSWTRGTGHYTINTDNFPGGLDALKATVQRFKQEGFHAGLHFLGASIYPPDPYITPVPDTRLVHDAEATLAADIDSAAGVIPTTEAPATFPAQDGGYEGTGAVLRIDDELMLYGGRAMEAPFGFGGCQRGYLGTVCAAHAKGARITHLRRSYGYCMFDMDTSLIDEVAGHFARVANACDIDMIYFDGSEALQGDHWYYNARLHKAFFDRLDNKDIVLQASSFTHYSWHILARSASADGHGDLKGYLDERSGCFTAFQHGMMPLDIGWYYGYDPSVTPDMFEYVLGATVAYNASMSFQVSIDAASRHPFMGDILDMIARYERLRLSGVVPEDMRARLQIDSPLAGLKTEEERAQAAEQRREYHLLAEDGHDVFQRVMYEPWREVHTGNDAWSVHVKQGPARAGIQFQALPGPWKSPGPSYRAGTAVILESFDDLAPYGVGATLAQVTQDFHSTEEDVKEGVRCAVYAANSARGTNDGWACMEKTFSPPLDISAHQAIGLWLRGDAHGGAFKLQLTDGAKAADYYISNDYTGWRYQQLPRHTPDAIDYAHLVTLAFYYNGLPANTAVSCAIDDVRALASADPCVLANPWITIDGTKVAYEGVLEAGQYAFLWPAEPWRRYGLPLTAPETGSIVPDSVTLPEGDHAVQFGCDESSTAPVRVRLLFEPGERYALPPVPAPAP